MDRALAWHPHRIDLTAEGAFRVGGASVDPLSRDAEFAGQRERLQPQTLKVLVALVRRRGEVVTREDLIDCCWDGRFVGEDVVNRSISLLRQFASRAGGFEIETVPKAGYRLVETETETGIGPRTFARLPITGAIVALLLCVAAAAWFNNRNQQPAGEPPIPTVAIAPFAADDAFTRQVAAAARVSLSHMLTDSGFPVRDAGSVAERKGVDFIIGGNIQRAGGKVVATINMIEARHGVTVFTNRFEEPNAAASTLADQIGASLTTNLTWTAALMILDRRDPFDPATLSDQLTQLRLGVEGGDMIRALELARQSERRAPQQPMSQVALAFNSSFALQYLPRDERPETVRIGRIAAQRAVKLAPYFGDSYIPWTILQPWVRMRVREERLRDAMKRDPNAPFVPAFLETLVSEAGRFDEAMEFARLAYADDRYKPAKLMRMVRDYEITGEPDKASVIYAQAVRWWPHNRRVHGGRLMGLLAVGKWPALAQVAPQISAEGFQVNPGLAAALAKAVQSNDASAANDACATPRLQGFDAGMCLVALSQTGALDAAFALADEMYPQLKASTPQDEERLWLDNPEVWQLYLLSIEPTAGLRRDPRFLAVADRVGLVDYWRSGRLPDFCTKRREPVCARLRG